MSPLEDLMHVRSQTAIALEAYLESLIDIAIDGWPLPSIHPRWRDPRDPSDLYEAPNLRRNGQTGSWDSVLRGVLPGAHIAIVGGSGQGKTLIAQMICRAVAQEGLELLQNRTCNLDDVIVPIWLTVDDVVELGSVNAAAEHVCVRQAEWQLLRRGEASVRPDRLRTYYRNSLRHEKTWLFVDALDGHEGMLGALAQLDCRVLVTARQITDGLVSGGVFAAVETAPLTPDQQRAFIEKWWLRNTNDSTRATVEPELVQQIFELCDGHSTLREMATNGRMLAVICAVAREYLRKPLGRIVDEVCASAIELILRGAARRNGAPVIDLDRRRRLLRYAACDLYSANRTGFSHTEWHEALSNAVVEDVRHPTDGASVDELTRDFARAGLLVRAGPNEWRFLYQAIFDFLARPDLHPYWRTHYTRVLQSRQLVHPSVEVRSFFGNDIQPSEPRFKRELHRCFASDDRQTAVKIKALLNRSDAVLLLGPAGSGKTVALLEAFYECEPRPEEIPCWLDASTTLHWRSEGSTPRAVAELIAHSCFGAFTGERRRQIVERLLDSGSRLVLFLDDIEFWACRDAALDLLAELCRDVEFSCRHKLVVSMYGTLSQVPQLAGRLLRGRGGDKWLMAHLEIDSAAVGESFRSSARNADLERQLASLHLLFYWALAGHRFVEAADALTCVLNQYRGRYSLERMTELEQQRAAWVNVEDVVLSSLTRAFGAGPYPLERRLEVLGRFLGELRLHFPQSTGIPPGWPPAVPFSPDALDRWLQRSPFLLADSAES